MNDLTFTDKGFADYVYWQFQDKKTIKKINNLLDDIKRSGVMQGIGKPEPLKHRSGYSRRIDDANRLVYLSLIHNCRSGRIHRSSSRG